MSHPVLYSFRRCPYAMRARLAIYYAGISVELREVVLRDKPPAMLGCSPKATVPVLQLTCGKVIDESRDIMQWALESNDPDHWLLSDRVELDQLIDSNDGEFKDALDRYKYPNRYQEEHLDGSEDEMMLNNRGAAEVFLSQLERRLTVTTYLLGDRASMADMAILPFVRQFAFVDKAWFESAPYPNVQCWLEQFLASDLFAAVMPKFNQWHEGDAPLIFTGRI